MVPFAAILILGISTTELIIAETALTRSGQPTEHRSRDFDKYQHTYFLYMISMVTVMVMVMVLYSHHD